MTDGSITITKLTSLPTTPEKCRPTIGNFWQVIWKIKGRRVFWGHMYVGRPNECPRLQWSTYQGRGQSLLPHRRRRRRRGWLRVFFRTTYWQFACTHVTTNSLINDHRIYLDTFWRFLKDADTSFPFLLSLSRGTLLEAISGDPGERRARPPNVFGAFCTPAN